MNFRPAPRPGFALALTLLIVVGVTTLAAAAVLVGMNGSLIRQYHVRENEMARAAQTALEQARAFINADRALYPDSLYRALETDAQVRARDGSIIPGLTRSTYVGPAGIATGQFGVHGTILTIVRNGNTELIRRSQVVQESFSKYAYFTDLEGAISFGGGDQIFGPAHSNDDVEILSSGATFFGPLTTARNIVGRNYGSYRSGYTENAARIPLPVLADLQKLQAQGNQGGTSFVGTSGSPDGRATTRIEFVALDLNGDGDNRDDNEGFFRVYQSTDAAWVVGANTVNDLQNSRTCGHFHNVPLVGRVFYSAREHQLGVVTDNTMAALSSSTRQCFLGGDTILTRGWPAGGNDGTGRWLTWPGTVSPLLGARPDRAFLFPITRPVNPSFKGVIYVNGDVAISGVLRGRVTVAATGNIIIADDVTYATNPSVGSCVDILGLFAGGNIVLANTPVNAPWKRRNQPSENFFSYDETTDEFVHGFLLTLNEFHVESWTSGSTDDEPCQTTSWGRGCLYLTGGIIQRQRGAVGTAAGYGYLKRYSYDPCGQSAPPPYFPTTGHFSRSAFYEVDPAGFNVDAYYRMLQADR